MGPCRATWTADPADDLVIETALAGGASIIVTGDRRLLAARVDGVEMMTVAEMVTRIEAGWSPAGSTGTG